ncbi:MAG: DMT family transporter [Acidaminococcaceae bacterium]|nr:DMT family transporter [Acidaminococcaceae bacterium]
MENMRSKGMWMIVFGASLWGASGTAIQYLFQQKHLTPLWLLMARMMIAGILMLLYAKVAKQDIWAIWRHKIYRYKIIIYALIGMFMTQYSFFMAINYGNAATATVLQYLMPVVVLFYSLWTTKRLPGKIEITSVCLAMLGTYILVTKGNWETLAISEQTLFWGILAAFFAAFYTIYPGQMLKIYPSAVVIGWSMFIGGIFINVFLQPWPFTGIMDMDTVMGMVVLILFGTVIAFYCYLESTKYIKASEVAALASIEPLSAVVLAVIFLNVSFGLAETAGVICIISMVFLLARQK